MEEEPVALGTLSLKVETKLMSGKYPVLSTVKTIDEFISQLWGTLCNRGGGIE